MTAREITDAVLAARGIVNARPSEQRNFIGSVQSCLHCSKAVRQVGEGMPGRWRIT
jgi:hypothetical protein